MVSSLQFRHREYGNINELKRQIDLSPSTVYQYSGTRILQSYDFIETAGQTLAGI